MAERDDLTPPGSTAHRNAEQIRQEIRAERQNIAQDVEQIGEMLQEKIEWRGYVRRSPYLALGAAAGAGFMASALYRQRTPPLQKLLDAAAGSVNRSGNQGVMKMAFLGVVSKLAMRWIQNAVTEGVIKEPGSVEPVKEHRPGMSDYAEPLPSSPDILGSHQPL